MITTDKISDSIIKELSNLSEENLTPSQVI